MNILRFIILITFLITSIGAKCQSNLLIENTDDFIHEITGEDYDNDGNTCETIIILVNNSIIPQNYDCANSLANWVVTVDFCGDGTSDLQYTYQSPFDDNTFDDTNGDGIPEVYLAPTEIGIEITIVLPEIEGPMSNHRVSWKLVDDCNNVKTAEIDILVIDKSPPTPVLIPKFVINVNTAYPYINLIADSLDAGSNDNCYSQTDLQYSFSDEISDKSLTIYCNYAMDTLTIIDVYVWDSRGNYAVDQVKLYVYDPCLICECYPYSNISGTVTSWKGDPVEGVEIYIVAALPEFPKTTITDEKGMYMFPNIPFGVEYTMRAKKIDLYTPQLTLLDLVKAQRHMLGASPFVSPYQYISADLNCDFKLKISDLLLMKKIALGVFASEPTSDAWKFIPSSFEFTNPSNPLNDLSEDSFQTTFTLLQPSIVDFVGIKMGDL
ncbi:MAG: hypothetical protein ACJA1A_003625 [Saprospiraceae bacterium]|jgi:hypothetical protein